ncbi:hypothetical protein ElyMa_006719100 [Elysia marginata]|uniref:Uncharacterized protein n=1 Tax=Elysia marginata TaxID=1093978 RepID=A0AAV4IWE6_9GAST|nr:hypothetical protein ElyMa_006719100 [Elysia marginata]
MLPTPSSLSLSQSTNNFKVANVESSIKSGIRSWLKRQNGTDTSMQRLPSPKSPPGSVASPATSPLTSIMRRKPIIPNVGTATCRTPTLRKMFVCAAGMPDFDEDDEVFETDSEDSCHFSPLFKVVSLFSCV